MVPFNFSSGWWKYLPLLNIILQVSISFHRGPRTSVGTKIVSLMAQRSLNANEKYRFFLPFCNKKWGVPWEVLIVFKKRRLSWTLLIHWCSLCCCCQFTRSYCLIVRLIYSILILLLTTPVVYSTVLHPPFAAILYPPKFSKVLASVLAMARYKVVMHRFHVVYHGMSLVYS